MSFRVYYRAWDTAANAAIAGDAAQHSLTVVTDVNTYTPSASELGGGLYYATMTDQQLPPDSRFAVHGSSSTDDVQLIGETGVRPQTMRGTDEANTVTPPTVAQLVARTLLAAEYATAAGQVTIDGVVDAIKIKTDLITAGGISIVSPVTEDGELELVAGDDYSTDNGRALTFTAEDYTGPGITGATVKLCLIDLATYKATGAFEAALEVTGAAAMDGADLVLTFEVTAAETASLEATEPPAERFGHVYQVLVEDSAGERITHALGAARVKRNLC